jgi:hypothetical protein
MTLRVGKVTHIIDATFSMSFDEPQSGSLSNGECSSPTTVWAFEIGQHLESTCFWRSGPGRRRLLPPPAHHDIAEGTKPIRSSGSAYTYLQRFKDSLVSLAMVRLSEVNSDSSQNFRQCTCYSMKDRSFQRIGRSLIAPNGSSVITAQRFTCHRAIQLCSYSRPTCGLRSFAVRLTKLLSYSALAIQLSRCTPFNCRAHLANSRTYQAAG